MPKLTPSARLENLLFGHRPIVIGLFVLVTMGFVWSAAGLHIDAGFAKQLPLKHPYMATFVKHQQEFGGANRLLVAIVARDGNMFTPGFFDALKGATDEVFFLPGVDRARVQSLFTPNVRYTEVVEDGIAAGNVIPDDFSTTPRGPGGRAAQHPEGRHRRAAGGQRLLGRDHLRRSSWSSIRRPGSASISSRWRGTSRRGCGRSSTQTSCPARPWTCTSSGSPR